MHHFALMIPDVLLFSHNLLSGYCPWNSFNHLSLYSILMQHENAIYIDYLLGNCEPDPLHFGALGDRSPTPAPEDETTEEEPWDLRKWSTYDVL